jgi:hypothetical protein
VASFADDIRNFERKTARKLDEVPRKVVFQIFKNVIDKTPVDTGRARANWQPSLGTPTTGTIEFADKDGSATIANMQSVLLSLNVGDVIFLTNNLPYIRRLEEGGYGDGPKTVGGFSRQAPAGMVALTVQEFQAVVNQVGIEVSRT